MQNYNELLGTDLIKDSRTTINNNFGTVASTFSGTAFPLDVAVGTMCFRTDTNSLYVYDKDNSWRLLLTIDTNGDANVAVADSVPYIENNRLTFPSGNSIWFEDLEESNE